jgi:solute carrier family 30 (zinc transporter), member 2
MFSRTAFVRWTDVLRAVTQVGEVVGGYMAHSLAVMTDAAHLFTDVGALLLSLFAMWLSGRPRTRRMSFGFHRAEILGAVLSVLMIWALTGVLVYEAVLRVLKPVQVKGDLMFIVASCGLFISAF